MKEILERFIGGERFSKTEAQVLLHTLVTQEVSPIQVGALLALFRTRPLTLEELRGFHEALFELRVPLDLGTREVIDVCGTGGDLKGSFNISTATAFCLASAGLKVVKHGNYSLSSVCGSSTVLEHFGILPTSDPTLLRQCLNETGACFLHAPLFQPSLRSLSKVRKELGIRTFFNALAPLLNPVSPRYQLIGTATREILMLHGFFLEPLDVEFGIVHSPDGYDEASLTRSFFLKTRTGEREVSPQDLGLSEITPNDLYGGKTVQEHAYILENVLQGKASDEKINVVAANAGIALSLVRGIRTLKESVKEMQDRLKAGEPYEVLYKIQAVMKSQV
jgi:anthranilate phosphoribosyltransferase